MDLHNHTQTESKPTVNSGTPNIKRVAVIFFILGGVYATLIVTVGVTLLNLVS